MSNGLGELLSKARENLGISLETASDATKIRMDFLEHFEKNSFDFNLPDIYKREFLKTYAEFLKLDIQEIMKLCPIKAFVPLTTSSKRREMVQQVAQKSLAVDHSNLEVKSDPESDDSAESNYKSNLTNIKKKYTYIAAALSLFLLLFIFLLSRHSSHPDIGPSNATGKNNSTMALDTATTPKPIKKKFSLMATDGVKILIRTRDSKDTIFSGTMNKGGEKIIEYTSPIQIYYDNGSVLSIELSSGERLHLESGLGAIEIK
ncbi:MAG: helix-turn-helix domain-containing protein [Puniceicoccales bacterium]|jgi:cytoskeletal protein RodZ|nr:helix-turn-helix domain-containing protein [Puniceicoccales bacterium]